MTPQFETVSAALQMGGHGGYVWFVYAVAVLVIAYLLLAPLRRGQRFMREQRGQLRREAAATRREVPDASSP